VSEDSIKRSFGSKGADVNLIYDVIVKAQSSPLSIAPSKGPRVHNLGRSVNAGRLKQRGWVGPVLLSIEAIKVSRSRLHPFDDTSVVSAVPHLQTNQPLAAMVGRVHGRRG